MDLSQEELAELADVSIQMIKRIEGRSSWVSDGMLAKLALVLGVKSCQLLAPGKDFPKKDATLATDALLRKLRHNLRSDIDSRFARLLPQDNE